MSPDEVRTIVREELNTYFEVPQGWWKEQDDKPLIEKLYATEHRTAVLLEAAGQLSQKVDGLETKVEQLGVAPIDVPAIAAALGPLLAKQVNDEIARRQES